MAQLDDFDKYIFYKGLIFFHLKTHVFASNEVFFNAETSLNMPVFKILLSFPLAQPFFIFIIFMNSVYS